MWLVKGASKKLDLGGTNVYIGLRLTKVIKRALVLYGLLGNPEVCINFNNAVCVGGGATIKKLWPGKLKKVQNVIPAV